MKRFYWLLALPYVVRVFYPYNPGSKKFEQPRYETASIECDTKAQCEDLAAALNYAHERRTQGTISAIHIKPEDLYWKDSKKASGSISGVPVPCGVDSKSAVDNCLDDSVINSKKAEWEDREANPEKQINRPEQKPIFDYEHACQGSCSEEDK